MTNSDDQNEELESEVLVPARSRGQTSDDRPSERSAEAQEETTEIKLPDLSSDEDDVDDEGRPGQSAEEDSQDVVVGDVIKTAEVMIHPRADCPVYPFKKTFKPTKIIYENEKFCEKCFCYICDIPVTECKNWRDMSLRHCNAYHTKEGPWKAVREKNKELKMKKESLLELKRKLRDERREKRKKNEEPTPKTKPKMDLSSLDLLEEKMKKIEEVRKKKEAERIKQKEIDRQEKIKNQASFTYQTNEAFESYESNAPPLVTGDNPLEDIEKLPDFSKAVPKPKIKVKIAFKATTEDDLVSDSDSEGLPPVMNQPSDRSADPVLGFLFQPFFLLARSTAT